MNTKEQAKQEWEKNFPVQTKEEHLASRRAFTKMIGISTLTIIGTSAVLNHSKGKKESSIRFAIADTEELAVGSYKLFRLPHNQKPGILIHLENGKYAAFSQSCTHLSCPVHYNPDQKQLVCPCHDGYFDATNGNVISGPPPRPLQQYAIEILNGEIFINV